MSHQLYVKSVALPGTPILHHWLVQDEVDTNFGHLSPVLYTLLIKYNYIVYPVPHQFYTISHDLTFLTPSYIIVLSNSATEIIVDNLSC